MKFFSAAGGSARAGPSSFFPFAFALAAASSLRAFLLDLTAPSSPLSGSCEWNAVVMDSSKESGWEGGGLGVRDKKARQQPGRKLDNKAREKTPINIYCC